MEPVPSRSNLIPEINSSEPFILRRMIDSWPSSKWDPTFLAAKLGSKNVTARFGPKTHRCGDILWETLSPREDTTVDEFLNWAGSTTEKGGNIGSDLVSKYSSDKYWGYVDYKYLFELVSESDYKDIDWSVFGIDRDAMDSTIWIGTTGAYTPCHYDTYGFNLHAQLYGRKRWVLFPPETPNSMIQPTRLPYEESSVFSSVDILECPQNLNFETRAKNSNPNNSGKILMVTLNPGDVLYLPSYWWHFVQCVDDPICVSVNTWVTVAGDAHMRIKECIAKSIVSLVEEGDGMPSDRGINPTEANDFDVDENLEVLTQLIESELVSGPTSEPSIKKRKGATSMGDNLENFMSKAGSKRIAIPSIPFADLHLSMRNGPLSIVERELFPTSSSTSSSHTLTHTQLTRRHLIDALLHPSTIGVLSELLFKK